MMCILVNLKSNVIKKALLVPVLISYINHLKIETNERQGYIIKALMGSIEFYFSKK